MRKKQAFAVLLAACMTISCIPATAYASVAEPDQVNAFSDQIDDANDPSGENDGNTTPIPTVTATPQETPEVTEEPVEEPTETPAEEPAAPQENLKETEPTATPTVTPAEEETKENVVFIGETGYKTLPEAIAAAAATTEKKAEILLKGDLEIAQTVEIPNDVTVTITAEKDVKITRAAAATGYTFKISEKGSLTLKKSEGTGNIAVTGAAKADSPLFQVDGKLLITDGVSIKGNESKGTAGAVFNKGTFIMNGGTISGNINDNGAVYNEGTFEVSGNVDISGNLKTDKKTKSNVTLANKGVVTVTGKLDEKAKIGLHAAKAENGLTVVKAGKDVKLDENLGRFTYDMEDGTKINTEGALEDVPKEPDKDVTAPALKEISVERISHDVALITFRSDEAGTYYVSIDDPDVDVSGKGNQLSENVNTEYQAVGLTKGEHIAYIAAKDAAGNVSDSLEVMIPAFAGDVQIADKADNKINGIADSYDMDYYDSKSKQKKYFVSFSATGAGMEFPDEVGNVRYKPISWSIGGLKNQSFREGYKGSFSGAVDPGTYELSVVFEQQEFNGLEWAPTGETDIKVAKIVLNKSAATPTPTKKATTTNNKKKTTTTSGTTGNGKASSVSTGDETDVAPILFLGGSAAALAAAMIMMKKKRSEEDE
ncbi:MAG: hypothetical protein ACOYBE_09400 [Blautia sp.]